MLGVLVKDPVTGFEKWPAWTLNWVELDWDDDILVTEVFLNNAVMPRGESKTEIRIRIPVQYPACSYRSRLQLALFPTAMVVAATSSCSRLWFPMSTWLSMIPCWPASSKKILQFGSKFHLPDLSGRHDIQDRDLNMDGHGDVHMSDSVINADQEEMKFNVSADYLFSQNMVE